MHRLCPVRTTIDGASAPTPRSVTDAVVFARRGGQPTAPNAAKRPREETPVQRAAHSVMEMARQWQHTKDVEARAVAAEAAVQQLRAQLDQQERQQAAARRRRAEAAAASSAVAPRADAAEAALRSNAAARGQIRAALQLYHPDARDPLAGPVEASEVADVLARILQTLSSAKPVR